MRTHESTTPSTHGPESPAKRTVHTSIRRRFRLVSVLSVLLPLLLLMHLAQGQEPPPSSNPTTPADSTVVVKPDSVSDSLLVDSLQVESVVVDSVTGDTLRVIGETLPADSAAALDSLVVLPEPLPPIIPPDSTAPVTRSQTSFKLTNREFQRHTFRDAGQAITTAPGLFPRHPDIYGQPFYVVPAGGSPRDVGVWFRGRPFDDPLTGATNFSTFVPEEIQIAEYEPAATGYRMSSGPTINLVQPYVYERVPVTRIVYRQGWYGLGRADWRIANQLTDAFAYHIGVNIAEFQGRYANTVANTSHLRIGGRQTIRNVGVLSAQWMETRDRWGRAFDTKTSSFHRNDIDISLSSGEPGDSLYREVAAWYVRSQSGFGYGDEDGNRLGLRAQQGVAGFYGHNLAVRADVERTAARFNRRKNNIDPQASRLTAGIGAEDQYTFGPFELQGSLRTEYSTISLQPDTTDVDDTMLIGGSASATYSITDSLRVLGLVSSSWRYPGLDESAGYWSVRTPDRWMDILPVPDYTTYYYGEPTLKPVKTDYAGAGVTMGWPDYRQVYVMSGVRQWRDQIITYVESDIAWTRKNTVNYTTYETSAYAWTPIWGPISAAGSFTYAEPITPTAPVPETYGWASLRFMDFYYEGQLRIRATVNAYYWGEYQTSSYTQDAAILYDAILNARIFNFEAYFGVRNLRSTPYQFIPGYPNMHRSEIWGVRWLLWK